MAEAKFKILNSKAFTATTPNPNPEVLGMVYDIQLDDADDIMVQYRVSVIDGAQGGIWTITNFGVNGYNTDPTSRLGKKIIDFAWNAFHLKFISEIDEIMDQWYNDLNPN